MISDLKDIDADDEAGEPQRLACALDRDLLFLVYAVSQMMRNRTDQRARRRGMSRAQWAILAWLERHPGLSQKELSELVDVEPITVARLVDRLEAAKLIERRHDPKDRRIWRLHLTPEAGPVLAEIADYRTEINELMGAGLSPATREAIVEGLLQMKRNLSGKGRAAQPIGAGADDAE